MKASLKQTLLLTLLVVSVLLPAQAAFARHYHHWRWDSYSYPSYDDYDYSYPSYGDDDDSYDSPDYDDDEDYYQSRSPWYWGRGWYEGDDYGYRDRGW